MNYTLIDRPEINLVPNQDLEVKENGDVNVSCDVESYPSSNVSWLRDGKQLSTTETGENEVTLYLFNNTCTDTGTYECFAYNGVGMPVSSSIRIDVLCKYNL